MLEVARCESIPEIVSYADVSNRMFLDYALTLDDDKLESMVVQLSTRLTAVGDDKKDFEDVMSAYKSSKDKDFVDMYEELVCENDVIVELMAQLDCEYNCRHCSQDCGPAVLEDGSFNDMRRPCIYMFYENIKYSGDVMAEPEESTISRILGEQKHMYVTSEFELLRLDLPDGDIEDVERMLSMVSKTTRKETYLNINDCQQLLMPSLVTYGCVKDGSGNLSYYDEDVRKNALMLGCGINE